jgi:hypothetical protein
VSIGLLDITGVSGKWLRKEVDWVSNRSLVFGGGCEGVVAESNILSDVEDLN